MLTPNPNTLHHPLAAPAIHEEPTILVRGSRPPDGRTPMVRKTAGEKTGWNSLLALPNQVRTPSQVEELRLEYRKFYEQQVAYTHRNQRFSFMDADHDVVDGRLEYTVEGQVVDFRGSGEHHSLVFRLCLMFPHVVNRDGTGIPIDSHIWLKTFYPNALVRPDLIAPYNQRGDYKLTINIGDTLRVRAHLMAYRDRKGCQRFGLDEWTPIDSRLRYMHRQADGHMVARAVETRLDTGMRVAAVDDRNHLYMAYSDRLEKEMLNVSAQHEDVAWHVFLTDDKYGYPTVCRDQRVVIDWENGCGHIAAR